MTQAEKLCSKVKPDLRPQAITLTNAVFAMQNKIDQQISVYQQMPLAQQVTVGTGEKMLRQNPMVQEFRATVRDYAQALKALQDILDNNTVLEETTSLDFIKSKIKVG